MVCGMAAGRLVVLRDWIAMVEGYIVVAYKHTAAEPEPGAL